MTDTKLDTTEFLQTDKYKVSFYNEKKEKIFLPIPKKDPSLVLL